MDGYPSGKAVGVRDVAAAAGFSFSTVAAALRGEAWVKAPTKAKVEEAAERLGYRRDAAASILASRRGHRDPRGVSVVYLTAMFGRRAPGDFARRLPGLGEAARALGLHFERIELRDAQHACAVHRRLLATGVEGVILGPIDAEVFFGLFSVEPFALVGDSRGVVLHGVDAVRVNHFTAMQRLLHRLAERGYRRVGVILRCHREYHADDYARYGAVMAFRDMVGSFEALEVLRWPFYRGQPEPGRQHMEEVQELDRWQQAQRFDVIVGFDEGEERLVAEACPDDPKRRPDYAAMLVRPAMRGRVAGVAYDQDVLVEPMLHRLLEKIRVRGVGISEHPVETVVDLPFLDGTSLRRTAP